MLVDFFRYAVLYNCWYCCKFGIMEKDFFVYIIFIISIDIPSQSISVFYFHLLTSKLILTIIMAIMLWSASSIIIAIMLTECVVSRWELSPPVKNHDIQPSANDECQSSSLNSNRWDDDELLITRIAPSQLDTDGYMEYHIQYIL